MLNRFFEKWEQLGEMTEDFANEVFENLDAIMEDEISQVETFAQQKNADAAFLAMNQAASLVNAATAKQPKIIRRLNKWVGKLQSALQNLGTSIGADQISISVGVPIGISVGLAWNI
jgi:hypothetical protein